MAIKGLDDVMKRINEEVNKIRGASLRGIVDAGFKIRTEAQKKCPVVTGNLRASAFVSWGSRGVAENSSVGGTFKEVPGRTGEAAKRESERQQTLADSKARVAGATDQAVVEIGFSAVYATRIHELPQAGKTGKPGASTVGEWKFLESALKENESEILNIVAREVRNRV